MKRKILTALMIASTLTLGVACHKRGIEGKANHITKKVSNYLELNTEQNKKLNILKAKIVEIRKEHQKNNVEYKDKIKTMILSDQLQEGDMKQLISLKTQNFYDHLPQFFPELADFHSSLSNEQKQKLITLLEKFAKRKDRKF